MLDDCSFDTKLIHFNSEIEEGAVNKPIYHSTSFAYDSAEELANVFQQKAQGFTYSRINNPTIASFEKRIADLEGGLAAVACSSGMAAIATAILSLVEKGDEIVAGNSLFGGSYSFLNKDLRSWDIQTVFVESTDIDAYKKAINKNTKLIYLETVGNPKLDIPDIKALSKLAHENNLPLVLDNTFMTPYLFKAKDWGADIVIHSTSKYINGSANSIGGIIVDLGTYQWSKGVINTVKDYLKFGPFAYLAKIRQDIFRNLGVCTSPFNASYNMLGLDTLALRMEKHCDNAMKLAKFLDDEDLPLKVNYPGLEKHPQHQLARKQFGDKYGGILTFELENQEASFNLINSLKLAKNLANIGDIRTLVIHPASTIYCNLSEEEREALGVSPGLIRVSVGIENADDIIKDFKQALSTI
ncbi:O-acetylhomoserine aminocarboxypropyltransferase/cysteine synthase family protein [Natronospora cellulosivora (SeqCode)]